MPGTAHCKFDHLFFASYKALGAWPPLALSPQALAAMTASSTCQLNLIRQFSHNRCIKNVTFGYWPGAQHHRGLHGSPRAVAHASR